MTLDTDICSIKDFILEKKICHLSYWTELIMHEFSSFTKKPQLLNLELFMHKN